MRAQCKEQRRLRRSDHPRLGSGDMRSVGRRVGSRPGAAAGGGHIRRGGAVCDESSAADGRRHPHEHWVGLSIELKVARGGPDGGLARGGAQLKQAVEARGGVCCTDARWVGGRGTAIVMMISAAPDRQEERQQLRFPRRQLAKRAYQYDATHAQQCLHTLQ